MLIQMMPGEGTIINFVSLISFIHSFDTSVSLPVITQSLALWHRHLVLAGHHASFACGTTQRCICVL